MTSPIFLHELPEEQLKKLSEEDIRKIREAEQLYWDHKPHTKFGSVALRNDSLGNLV